MCCSTVVFDLWTWHTSEATTSDMSLPGMTGGTVVLIKVTRCHPDDSPSLVVTASRSSSSASQVRQDLMYKRCFCSLGGYLRVSLSAFYCVLVSTLLYTVPKTSASTLSNLNWSSIFHCWKAWEIHYKILSYFPTHLMCVAALPYKVKNSHLLWIWHKMHQYMHRLYCSIWLT